MRVWIIGLILLLSAAVAEAKVIVTDGDSLVVDGKKIRLIGIDSPEYDQECQKADKSIYLCGKEASKYMKAMVKQGLERGDKLSCTTEGKDRYKRSLSICKLGAVNLNEEMVRAGWAVTYRHDMYKGAESEAKEAQRGIWQGKFMRPELHRILKRYKKS